MMVQWLKRTRSLSLGACAALLVAAGASRAGDNDGELRALVRRAPLRPGKVQVFYPEATSSSPAATGPIRCPRLQRDNRSRPAVAGGSAVRELVWVDEVLH